MKTLIGLYTCVDDSHLKRIVPALQKRGLSFFIFDRAEFPQKRSLAARLDDAALSWHGMFYCEHERYYLQDIRSILYRRPNPSYNFIADLSPDELEFAKAEARKGFDGILRSLSCLWVSHPDALQAAEWKPRQLQMAQHLGLRVPKTLITNSPEEVLQFFEECGGEVIYKTLSMPPSFVSDDTKPDVFSTVYTNKLTYLQLKQFAQTIPRTANLFQE